MNDNQNTTTQSEMPPLPWGFMLNEEGMVVEDPSQTGYPPVNTTIPAETYTRNSYQSAYSRAMDNLTAEDLDRKCTEMHEYNTAYRERHGL